MVLYPKDAESEMHLTTRLVDILHQEQLTEHYLCDINAHGEVREPKTRVLYALEPGNLTTSKSPYPGPYASQPSCPREMDGEKHGH